MAGTLPGVAHVDFEIGTGISLHRWGVIGRNELARGAAKVRELRPRATPTVTRSEPQDVTSVGSNRVALAVKSHLSLVWHVLRRSGLRAADADDATQDVFWVFAQRQNDVPEGSTRAFLVATALRVASDRRKSKWNRCMTEPVESDMPSRGSPPDEQVQIRRQTELLDRVLADLLPEEREIFILFEIEQMTRREVAEALGIPEGTAASRLRRARDSFERTLRRTQLRRELSNV